MATFENITNDITGYKSGDSFYIDKYDTTSYDNIEKSLDEILEKPNNEVIKEYITKYIPEEEQNITYNFKCSTNTIYKLNTNFIASQKQIAGQDDDDFNELNKVIIEKMLFNSVKNYSGLIEKKNYELKQRYIILQEKILKNEVRRNLLKQQQQQQSMFAFFNRITYLGVISGVSVFCVKLFLISNLTNPAVWIGFLSKIYANPLNFQYFIDIVSTLNIFTFPEVLTLKDMFSKVQFLIKDVPLFSNKEYVKTLVECIFNPTVENAKILKNLSSNKDFKDHEKYPQLMQFFSYIKSVTDSKKVFKDEPETDTSEKKPIWKKNLFNDLISLYTSPIGYNALTSLKIGTDAYAYFSQSADFFKTHKDANAALLLKGITLNSINSLSFNTYSRIFTQKLLNSITGGKDNTLLLDIPIIGNLDVNNFFVTTVDSFLNIQTKSIITGYFTKLEKEVGYDPEKEKKEKEQEKKNSIESVKENIIKKGTLVKKYKDWGYSNDEITKIIDKPKRPNEYKFILNRYIKDFYNTFLDFIDDPLLTVDLFTNVSFVFNIIQNNFYSILMGGSLYYLPQMVLTGVAHKSYLNLSSLTGNLLPINIIPIKVITAYFRFKYGSDIVINRQFELFKYKLINDIFSDFQTLLNEMQGVFFDTSLGMSLNKYLEKLNDTIIGKIFNMSCRITSLFVNYAVLPTAKNKVINLLPNIKFPIIETLEDKEKSERLFTFIDNKMSNLIKSAKNDLNNNLEVGKLIKNITKDFGEFINISKIIEGTIIPFLNADGFFEWSGKMKSPLEGSIIKFVKKPTETESVDEKIGSYSGDILSEKKQDESRVDEVKIVLGTDNSGYGNFKVVDTKEIKHLLTNVYDIDTRFDPRKKPTGFFDGIKEKVSSTLTPKMYKISMKTYLKPLGFKNEHIDILINDDIKISHITKIMNEVDPVTGIKPTANQVMASIIASDNLQFKTGNLIKDYSMSNIYYYYYYKLFINDQLKIQKDEIERKKNIKKQKEEEEILKLKVGSKILYEDNPAKIHQINANGTFNIIDNNNNIITNVTKDLITVQKGNLRKLSKQEQHRIDEEEINAIIQEDENTLSQKNDFDKFCKFLQDRYNILENNKRNDEEYSKYEHAILTDMLTSLKTRQDLTQYNILWDSRGDVVKAILINDNGINYLSTFFSNLYTGVYDNPLDPNIKLKTEILDKSRLVHTENHNAYFSINFQHSYGVSPQVVDASKFLNSIEMLISLNSDNLDTASLSAMISDLEIRASTNINIQESLDKLNELYKKPITEAASYYKNFVDYFKNIFCNFKTGGCNKENMILFKHLGFDYSKFNEEITNVLNKTTLMKELEPLINNSFVIEFLKKNSEIQYTCNIEGKKILLNKNFINMDTGNLMNDCINTSTPINFSNKTDVLQTILRPEVIFKLSKIKKMSKDEYNTIKSSVSKSWKNAYGLTISEDQLNQYDDFFTLFNSIAENGIKIPEEENNKSIFSIISDVIDLQQKEFFSKENVIDPIEKYKLNVMFDFNKILKDQTRGFIDPAIKDSYADYFTLNEDILDNTQFLKNNQSELDNLFSNFTTKCGTDINDAKKILDEIKNNYIDKDVIGSINLNGNILRMRNINFNQDDESSALNSKLNDYIKFEQDSETGFSKKKQSIDILLQRNINEQNLGELCKDGGLNFMKNYIEERKQWYNMQSEIFKLYILHNTNDIFKDLSQKYDKFTNDIKTIIEDYETNLNIVWQNAISQDQTLNAQPSPQLTGMADELKASEENIKIVDQVRQQNIQDIASQKEKTEQGEALSKESTKTETKETTKTETKETITESTKTGIEETTTESLQYGTASSAPAYLANSVGSLVKLSPSTIYTDVYKQMPPIDTEITQKIDEKTQISNPSAECFSKSSNWWVKYVGGPEQYSIETRGDTSISEINSYNCKTSSLMNDTAEKINYFIIQIGKILIPVIQTIEEILTRIFPTYAYAIRAILTVAKTYSKCFIYIFHDIMLKKFSSDEMIDKLTNNVNANLGDKIVFGLWSQMVTTLKTAEKNVGIQNRSDDMICSNILPFVGVQDITNLEDNAYALIDDIGSKLQDNVNMRKSFFQPSVNNLPGYINTGLRDVEDGINYSNYVEVAAVSSVSFLTAEEKSKYDELIKKPVITCNDLYPKFDKITALKLSIFSLINNPTKNFFYTNLNCRLFGSSSVDIEKKDKITITRMLYIFFFTDWTELIGDFLVIMLTNEGLKPFFLTKIFGSRTQGMNINFIRDLIDDSFIKAKKQFSNENDYKIYIKNQVSNSIYTFIFDIIKTFFGKIIYFNNKKNGKWIGIDEDIYENFKTCKSGLCSFDAVTLATKKAIVNVQQEIAVLNPGYLFENPNTTDFFDLESEKNKLVINAIVNSENYDSFIQNLRTTDPTITDNQELITQWKKSVYNQYKEILTFYKEYSEYNTIIIKRITEKMQTEQNVGFQYRLNSYNYRNNNDVKLETFLDDYLIKPCEEGQILYFYTKDDVANFSCLDFKDISITDFNTKQNGFDILFNSKYSEFAENSLKDNIKILDIFVNSQEVICDNPEYCSGISTDYSNFVKQQTDEFIKLTETKTDVKILKDFQRKFFDELSKKLTTLTTNYQEKENDLRTLIRNKTDEIEIINKDLKNTSLSESDKFIKMETKNALLEEINKLQSQLDYFLANINKIKNSKTGLLSNINEAKKIGGISTPEMTTRKFIIKELKNPDIDPDYFAYLYSKLFEISEDNVDILTIYEFFSSDKNNLSELESKITNNKYYLSPNYKDINEKLITNSAIRKAILDRLKVFLYKNQKEQYMYSGNFVDGYYIENKNGQKQKITTGFDIVKDNFEKIKPHDNGIEEIQKHLDGIQTLKEKLEKKQKEATEKSSLGAKAVLKKIQELKDKEIAITKKLTDIRDLDLQYYNGLQSQMQTINANLKTAKRIEDSMQDNYNTAETNFNNVVKTLNSEYYNEQIKEYKTKLDKNMEEFKDIEEYLKKYNEEIKELAEIDYNKARDESKTKIDNWEKEINDLELSNLKIESALISMSEDVNAKEEDYDNLFDTWSKQKNIIVQNYKLIDQHLNFLNKNEAQQKLEKNILARIFDREGKDTKNYKGVDVEKKRERQDELRKDLFSIPAYVENGWEKLQAFVVSMWKSVARYFGGETELSKKERYENAQNQLKTALTNLNAAKEKRKNIEEELANIEGAIFDYIEPSLFKDKRPLISGAINDVVTQYDDVLNYGRMTNRFYSLSSTPSYIEFTKEMTDLREELKDLEKSKTDIENDIITAKKQLDKTEKNNIIDIEKRIDEITNREKELIQLKEKKIKEYKDLLEKIKETDKSELQQLNHKFGYSIKIDGNGIVSLQKTFNDFTGRSQQLLTLFENTESREFIQSYGTGIFIKNVSGEKAKLGKDSTGNPLPLNDKKYIVDDTIKDGFPPIIFGNPPIEDQEQDINVYDKKYVSGLLTFTQNAEEFSKQKINKYIKEHYMPIELENGKYIYVLNTQIKLWSDTFVDFKLEDFVNALKIGMKEKEQNSLKDYSFSQKHKNNILADVKPSQEEINSVFGVNFNYFNNLQIRGVPKAHPEQQNIENIRNNRHEKGTMKGKIVDKKLLDILPLNIYRTLNNYAINFDSTEHPFNFFFTEKIELVTK